jgi:hypothetical protein
VTIAAWAWTPPQFEGIGIGLPSSGVSSTSQGRCPAGFMCDARRVRAIDDDGSELNAQFAVKADGSCLSLVLESSGGKSAGSDRPRNDQYVPALRLLLRRLGDRDAVLMSALVASASLAGVPETERTVFRGPLDLAEVTDYEDLRLSLTTPQGNVGLPQGVAKAGNNRKRLQLRLDVPGYGPGDADRLAADLAAPVDLSPRARTEADEVLRSLIGEEIRTITGEPNMVVSVQGRTALVDTSRSPQRQPVEIADVQQAMDRLRTHEMLRVTVEELGHSSAFIGAVLATLPGVRTTTYPATIILDTAVGAPGGSDPKFAVLDSNASVKVRREQAQLRNILASGRELADCALCGHQYPLRFLVAAHIKKRAICSDDERRDLGHVAMLACTFGCDALYEAGWITVGPDGHIQTSLPDTAPEGRLRDHLEQLASQYCQAHSQDSEPYFDWHRTTIFRGNC